jgi:hypothetical protein
MALVRESYWRMLKVMAQTLRAQWLVASPKRWLHFAGRAEALQN